MRIVKIFESNELKKVDKIANALDIPSSSQQNVPVHSEHANLDTQEAAFIEESAGSYLFDPVILDDAGVPHESSDFYLNLDFVRFKSLIDFQTAATQDESSDESSYEDAPRSTQSKRSSTEKG